MTRRSLIDLFVSHKVAANVLILVFLALGITALLRLHAQFLPNFSMNTVTVSIAWSGASPSDVEQAITTPVEKELTQLEHVLRMNSVSSQGSSLIVIEFKHGADMSRMIQDVRNRVGLVPHLPADSLKPQVKTVDLYDPIARVIIAAKDHPRSLRTWAYQAKHQLLADGVDKVSMGGLFDQEIHIGVTPDQLLQWGASVSDVADQVQMQSQDVAAGELQQGMQPLRSLSQARTESAVAALPIISGDAGQVLHLLDIAQVEQRPVTYAHRITYRGMPAIELELFRAQKTDALAMAKVVHQWKEQVSSTWPSGVTVHVYYEFWKIIKQRIDVLLKNGTWGLLLIYGLLFLFLTPRLGFWVAVSVPLSLLGALFALWVFGGSINMITLFALIMSLGIIVDDTIVVAEEGLRLHQAGEHSDSVAALGAKRMVVPIMAASLSTIAAFSPLLLLGGLMGQILMAIPLVVICVVFSSLIECFLILPYHVKQSLIAREHKPIPRYREKLDKLFVQFRDVHFKRFIAYCMYHKTVVFSAVIVSIVLSIGLLSSGRLPFTFFPSPDGTLLNADVTFSAGASEKDMMDYMQAVEQAAWRANQVLKEKANVLNVAVQYIYKGSDPYEMRSRKRLASIVAELSSPESRRVTNQQFIERWQSYLPSRPYVSDVRIMPPRNGLPGADIDFGLYGADATVLKQAAEQLKKALASYRGVYNVTDNMPYAQNEILFTLKSQAHALGLTTNDIGRQLRAAFAGVKVQTHYIANDKVSVRVQLDDQHRSSLATLSRMPIKTKPGTMVPLDSLVQFSEQRAFDSLQHLSRQLTVNVQAEVDATQGNANHIIHSLKQSILPQLAQKMGVHYTMQGRSMEEEHMLHEMQVAVAAMLVLIYLILTWASGSYLWPVLVMLAIPLGLQGALYGHWLMGYDLTLLSLFGFFGLTGIVINDSIILLFRYQELVNEGMPHSAAIIEACCQRLRPVVLTSLTTIAGLLPLMFERSMQAQFLIPMAISICFGLVFSTVLILVVIPSLIALIYERRFLVDQENKLAETP